VNNNLHLYSPIWSTLFCFIFFLVANVFIFCEWFYGAWFQILGYQLSPLPVLLLSFIPSLHFLVLLFPSFRLLKITKEGFSYRTAFGFFKVFKWSEIEEFGVYSHGKIKLPAFKFSKSTSIPLKRSGRFNGYDCLLDNTYGKTTFELVKLLADWKSRHQ
jgi:hypothetical protein